VDWGQAKQEKIQTEERGEFVKSDNTFSPWGVRGGGGIRKAEAKKEREWEGCAGGEVPCS